MNRLVPSLAHALPFWMSLGFLPVVVVSALVGGWTLLLIPVFGWVLLSVLDKFSGLETRNMDPQTGTDTLFWYRLITLLWAPIQMVMIVGALMWVSWSDALAGWEKIGFMVGVGVVTGAVGINYAHELIHQRNRWEQRLGELLLISVAYGHFRTEHLLVHHRYVGTPRDPVTARYNESFYRFFPRVLVGEVASSWTAEAAMLARKGLPVWHRSNPFYRYFGGFLGFVALSFAIGGWAGVGYWLIQSLSAIYQLEIVNYVEHYGLTRKHLGDGKYEPVRPRHSWNASHKMTNFLLINLQRHSDHHYKPDRRFPLLQTYSKDDAPQLPYGYPMMALMALIPPVWRARMNRRVDRWRAQHYPEIEDWGPYNAGATPLPR